MIKLLYTGLKVSIQNVEQHIHTSLLESYRRNKYLFITRIDDMKDIVYVSYAPEGSIIESVKVEHIDPIYDRDLYDVLREKAYKCYELEKDIKRIKVAIEDNSKEN